MRDDKTISPKSAHRPIGKSSYSSGRSGTAQLGAVVEYSEDAIVSKDLDGVITSWNLGAEKVYGYTADEAIGRPAAFYFPKNKINELSEMTARVRRGDRIKHYETERIRKDGKRINISLSVSPIKTVNGEVIGIASIARNITRRTYIENELRENEERLSIALAAGKMGTWDLNFKKNTVVWSQRAREIFGFPDDLVIRQDTFLQAVHVNDRGTVLHERAKAFEFFGSGEYRAEYRVVGLDGTMTCWVAAFGKVYFDLETKSPVRFTGIVLDITERKKSEERLRRNREENAFLAKASGILVSSLDAGTSIHNFGELLVPFVADWCAIDIVGEDNVPRRIAGVHQNREKGKLIYSLWSRYGDEGLGINQVLQTGESKLYKDIPDSFLIQEISNRKHLALLKELGCASAMIVPLIAREKIIGAITLVRTEATLAYGDDDLEFAETLASRAAIAYDNARLYRRVVESDRAKDQFLATLAHELRNPLAPILSSVELMSAQLQGSGVVEEESLSIVKRQVANMSRLLEDLLEVSRITRGKITLKKELVRLQDIIEESVKTANPMLKKFNHTLFLDVPERALYIMADPLRIEQIIVNLLSNASKYTPPGGSIFVSVTRKKKTLQLSVRDTGIGIAPDMLSKVFNLFTQGQSPLQSEGGLGVGLTMVKSLAQMHDGVVVAKSEGLGKGSEFSVYLPLAREKEHSIPKRENMPKEKNKTGKKILIVDDNQDITRSFKKLITLMGHTAEVAHDGSEALTVTEHFKPDVVLLDIGLPGMSGYDIARELRKHEGGSALLLVAITGYGQEEDVSKSKWAGFDHHFTKPVGLEALKQVLG